MNIEWVQSMVDALGWCLVHFLWQGAAVALCLWLALLATRRAVPQLRYAISGAAMLAMFVWAALTLISEFAQVAPRSIAARPLAAAAQEMPAVGAELAAADASAPVMPEPALAPAVAESPLAAATATAALVATPPTSISAPWLPCLVGLWALGVVVLSLRLLRAWSVVRALKRSGIAPCEQRWRDCFAELCRSMRVSQPARLLVSAKARVPMVIGWIKPIVLVPAGLLSGLPSAQVEAILAHELAHIRRHDYLINLLQTVVETLLFFHPAVWWAGAQLRKEREHCCDDVAATVSGGALGYAGALAALEGMRAGNAPALGLAASDGSLLGRVRRLVGCEDAARPAWPALAVVSTVLAGLLWAACVPLADAADEDEEKRAEPGEMVTVRVVNGDTGKPVPRAVLGINVRGKKSQLTTGSDGEIPVARELLMKAWLRVDSPGFLNQQMRVVAKPAGAKAEPRVLPDPYVLTVFPGAPVSGRVLGPDGAPVAGAIIHLSARIQQLETMKKLGMSTLLESWDHGQYANWTELAESDAQGRFHYTLPEAGDLSWSKLRCQAVGFAPFETDGAIRIIDPDRKFKVDPSDIVLSRGIKVRPRVVDAQGKPLAGMTARTMVEFERGTAVNFGVSDNDGYLAEVLMNPGEFTVRAPSLVGSEEQKLPRVHALAELPRPFAAQPLTVPDDAANVYQVTWRALPHRLVQFDWDERRPLEARKTGFVVEGTLGGTLWKTRLMHCDVGGGVARMCALVPDQLEKLFLRMGDYHGVYHHIPAGGGEAALGVVSIRFSDAGQALGTIVAEKAAKLVLNVHGRGGERLSTDHLAATSRGRFGEREQRGRFDGDKFIFLNLYPGESVDFSIKHPKFKGIKDSEKNLQAGELRESEVELVADDNPALCIRVFDDQTGEPDRRTGAITPAGSGKSDRRLVS